MFLFVSEDMFAFDVSEWLGYLDLVVASDVFVTFCRKLIDSGYV